MREPGPVVNLTAIQEASLGSVTLRWVPPMQYGDEVTSYDVRFKPVGAAHFTYATPVGAFPLPSPFPSFISYLASYLSFVCITCSFVTMMRLIRTYVRIFPFVTVAEDHLRRLEITLTRTDGLPPLAHCNFEVRAKINETAGQWKTLVQYVGTSSILTRVDKYVT